MWIRRLALLPPLVAVTLVVACATNQAETKSELKQRAQAGDIDAQYQLGKRYAHAAFPQDTEAVYWLCKAAKDGHVPAQLELAGLYEGKAKSGNTGTSGKNRLSTRGSAYFWYTAAASQGSEQAFVSREHLEASMDADEVLEAKRRATRWKQSVCVEP